MYQRVCPFCSSEKLKKFDTEGEWKIDQCQSCDFIFTNPQPTIESLASFYEEDYFKDERHISKFYNEDGTMKTAIESYENRIIDIEGLREKRGRLLEIGSERGGFLNVMKQRGWDVEGVEISKDAGDLALKNGIKTFIGVFNDFEADNNFDSICMYQTLEHVPDPKEIIEKAFNILNEKGTFVVEVPNVKCFEQKYSKKRRQLSYDLPRHLNHFSPDFLKNEFLKAGFQKVVIDLYPPQNLVRLITWLSKMKKAQSKEADQIAETKEQEIKIRSSRPMAVRHVNFKTKLISTISKLFPGWRFTITGIK